PSLLPPALPRVLRARGAGDPDRALARRGDQHLRRRFGRHGPGEERTRQADRVLPDGLRRQRLEDRPLQAAATRRQISPESIVRSSESGSPTSSPPLGAAERLISRKILEGTE